MKLNKRIIWRQGTLIYKKDLSEEGKLTFELIHKKEVLLNYYRFAKNH